MSIELDRELVARGGLYEFLKMAWPLIDPHEYIDGPHIRVLCEYLEDVSRRKIRNGLINLPPSCSKSVIVGTAWVAWHWATQDPAARWIFASYAADVAQRSAKNCAALVTSTWYAERWPSAAVPEDCALRELVNEARGSRMFTSTGASLTGKHGDFVIADDPHDAADKWSETELQRGIHWWTQVASSRLRNPRTSCKLVVGQRVAANDFSGHLISAGGYDHLCLPMQYQEDSPDPRDWRTQQDELLWPARYGAEEIAPILREQGSSTFGCQYNQRPIPSGGGIFKMGWCQTWDVPPGGGVWVLSCDLSFKDHAKADYCSFQVWCASGGRFYLMDEVHARLDFVAALDAIKRLRAKWSKVTGVLIESAANGAAIVSALRREGVPGIVEISPIGKKEERAAAVAPMWEARNVYLPATHWMPSVGDYVNEICAFPGGRNDDRVDAMSMALNYLARYNIEVYVSAWTKITTDRGGPKSYNQWRSENSWDAPNAAHSIRHLFKK